MCGEVCSCIYIKFVCLSPPPPSVSSYLSLSLCSPPFPFSPPLLPSSLPSLHLPLSLLPLLISSVILIGIEKECRVIRDFHWKTPLTKLFDTKVIIGHFRSQQGEDPMPPYIHMLTPANFFQNEYVTLYSSTPVHETVRVWVLCRHNEKRGERKIDRIGTRERYM